jgi:hypothetical protein
MLAEAHCGGANFSRENFAGDCCVAGEKPGAEESDERPEDQEPQGISNEPVKRHKNCGNQQVSEIRFSPAEGVRKKSERCVPQPFSGSKHQIKCGAENDAEAASAA